MAGLLDLGTAFTTGLVVAGIGVFVAGLAAGLGAGLAAGLTAGLAITLATSWVTALAFPGAVTLGTGTLFADWLALTLAMLALTADFLAAGLATGLATDFEGALAPVLGDALAFAADFFTQSLLEGQQPNNAITP